MKNKTQKILIYSLLVSMIGLFAFLSPSLAKVINFGTVSDTSYFPGNIGIGATTTDKLNIDGTLRATGVVTLTNLAGTGTRCVNVTASGALGVSSENCGTSSGGDNLGNGVASSNITLGSYWLSGDGGNEGVFVKSDGNVGIGTTNPGYKLHVSSGHVVVDNDYSFLMKETDGQLMGLDSHTDNSFRIISNGSQVNMVILNGGNVGIGNTNPSTARLVLAGSGTYNLDFGAKPATNLGAPILDTDAATKSYVDTAVSGVSGGSGVSYWVASGGDLYATSTATSIGIGTTNPTGAPLEVYGGFYVTGGSGDVTGEGAVNATDALNIARHIEGLITLEPWAQAAGDMDGDGVLTYSDTFSVLRKFNALDNDPKLLRAKGTPVYDMSGNIILGVDGENLAIYGAIYDSRVNIINGLSMYDGNLQMNGSYINNSSTSTVGLLMDASNNAQLSGINLGTNGGYISYAGTNAGIYLTSTSSVGIGTTSVAQELTVNGDVQADAYYYSSDRNLKKDIRNISSPLEKALKLRGVFFKWKESGEPSYGFIAQEVEKVAPELVFTDSSGLKSVAYGNVSAILTEAIKAQQTQIEILNLRLKALEEKLK